MFNPYFQNAFYVTGVNLPKFLTSQPGVYKISLNPALKNKQPLLEFKYKEFSLPPKLYGEIPKLADFFYEGFKRRGYKGGVMLTGEPGSGKTELAKLIANKAIKDGLRVIDLSNTNLTNEMIEYLETLDEVVLFFDEFGKIIRGARQDKLLTLFSNPAGVRRIIIITENDRYLISPFIRNRPGRIRYSKHFDKVPLSTVQDYLEDKGVDEDFYKEVIELYKRMPRFAFDHLQAIVDEYLTFPELSLKEILEILNLDFITGNKMVIPNKVLINAIEFRIVNFNPEALQGIIEYHNNLILSVEIPREYLEDEKISTLIHKHPSKFQLNAPPVNNGPMMYPGQQPMPSPENTNPILIIRVNKDDLQEFVDDKMIFVIEDGDSKAEIYAEVKLDYENKTKPNNMDFFRQSPPPGLGL